jgi:hypothetical protein
MRRIAKRICGRIGLLLLVLIIFVSPAFAKKLRVMTYNIHVGVGMDKKLDLHYPAAVIADPTNVQRLY